jgi:hypothetical protein
MTAANDDNPDPTQEDAEEPLIMEGRDARGKFAKGNDHGFSKHPENINPDPTRKRGPSLNKVLREILSAGDGYGGETDGRAIAHALVQETIKEALAGSFPHLKEIWNRLDGKEGSLLDNVPEEEPKTKDEHHAEALRMYREIVTSQTASARERLLAQSEINTLLGLAENEATPQEHARGIQQALADMLNATLPEDEDEGSVTECDDDKQG